MNTKANIIIIEDEKNICNFIETVLSPQGYQVTSANTGTDGLKLIESLKPDVVLLDLGLPDMDGLQLILLPEDLKRAADAEYADIIHR